jgi:hypothetical protein
MVPTFFQGYSDVIIIFRQKGIIFGISIEDIWWVTSSTLESGTVMQGIVVDHLFIFLSKDVNSNQ